MIASVLLEAAQSASINVVQSRKGVDMVFDFSLRTGLVFGLEYEEVLVVDSEDEKDEGVVANCIALHLGFFTASMMY
jgi:hypothetical protein